jgi:regulatory protein
LDGEFGFGIDNTLALTLHVGQELSEKQIADMLKRDEFDGAFHRANHFLGYKPRTSGEVTRKLLMLKYNDETVHEVIEKLTEQNLLDDKRFATQWVEERSSFKPKGKKVLAMELKRKNVDPEIIQQALVNLDSEGLALKAAHEYAQKLSEADRVKFTQRISGFLIRRGFESRLSSQRCGPRKIMKNNLERGKN